MHFAECRVTFLFLVLIKRMREGGESKISLLPLRFGRFPKLFSQVRKISPELLRDFMEEYIKFYNSPNYQLNCGSQSGVPTISRFPISGCNYGFPVRGNPVRILWIANFRFPFYEICVQNQWGHKFFRSQQRTPTLVARV